MTPINNHNHVILITLRSVINIHFRVNWIIASEQLQWMSPKRRKCLYHTEANSKYYSIYTRTLCLMTCRIEAALELCNCIPYFYSVGKITAGNIENKNLIFSHLENGPSCNVSGLYCLSQHNWYNRSCVCPEECESMSFFISAKRSFKVKCIM